MSSAGSQKTAGPLHPVKHKLDELDALLQRMLALPVNQPDSSVPGDIARDAQHDLTAATFRLIEAQSNRSPALPAVPLAEPVEDLLPPSGPLVAVDSQERLLAASDGPIGPKTEAPVVGTAPALAEDSDHADFVEESRSIGTLAIHIERPSALLWPLVAVDHCYDQGTRLFGPLGRLFRSDPFKTCLGVVGTLLIVASIAWGALDWWGWSW